MRVRVASYLAAMFVLTASASGLPAQSEFDAASQKIAAYWNEENPEPTDPVTMAKVRRDFNELPGQLRPLIDAGILSYLNASQRISPEELTIKIAKALSYPYMNVQSLADADGNVSVIPLPHQDGYAIAYNISNCASCTISQVEIFIRRDDRWVLTDRLDNPVKDNAVHLAWVGSQAEPLLALYGVHWGDAHNRLDIHLYSVDNGFEEVWSMLNLSQGEIAIQGNRITLKYWTQPTRWTDPTKPFQEERQVFDVANKQVKLLDTKLSEIER